MGKPSTDENGLGGGVVSYRESPARPPPEAQTSFEIFNSRNVSGVEGIAALALLACGQSASRSEGRVDSHSWDELLGSGGEPTGNCISSLVPLLTENSSGASTRSSSNTSTSSSGGESSLVGGDGNNNRSKASRPSGCIGDDPGPMPVRRPFERRPGASGAVAGNAGGGNDRRRHRTTRNSWDLKVSAVASTFHRDTPVRDTGLDHAHACEQPPWVRPGTPDPATGVYRGDGRGGYGGDVRRVLSETRHSKPMLRCPSFDPHKDVDLPLEVSSWSGTSTDVHSPLRSGITVAGNRTAGGVEAGVAIGGGGGGTEVAAANCPPEWTHAPPLRGDTSTRGTEAAAPTSVSGGSAVTPSWMLQPVEDKSPNVQKPSFDALKMMIPGLESFTGGGRGAAVSSGGIAPGSRVAPGRTDGMLQTPSTLPMSGEGPGTPSTTSHTISGMPLGQGVPGEPSMLGGIGSLKRPFSAVEGSDNGKAGALARPTEMLTPRQMAIERYRRKKLRRPYVKAAREQDPARSAQNKSRERPRQRGKFVKAQPDYVSITDLQARSDLAGLSGESRIPTGDSLRASSAASSVEGNENMGPGIQQLRDRNVGLSSNRSVPWNDFSERTEYSGKAHLGQGDDRNSDYTMPAEEDYGK